MDYDDLLKDGNTPLRDATTEQLIAALSTKCTAFVLAVEMPGDDRQDGYRVAFDGSCANALGLARYAEGYLDRLLFKEVD